MAESTKPAKAALPKSVFEVDVPNHELLKLAYDAFLANSRQASATTKTRGEVRGGGKKPWKQKGTGRARFGSTRNPIWRHGGIVFGPRGNENYSKKRQKKDKIGYPISYTAPAPVTPDREAGLPCCCMVSSARKSAVMKLTLPTSVWR